MHELKYSWKASMLYYSVFVSYNVCKISGKIVTLLLCITHSLGLLQITEVKSTNTKGKQQSLHSLHDTDLILDPLHRADYTISHHNIAILINCLYY